jgi:flagellar biosynthesis/type III secretory pathway protein FliH
MMKSATHSRFIVRGDTLRAHKEAHTILADANVEASCVKAAAEAERFNIFEAARQQGLRQGISQAANIAVNAANAIDEFWREREAELAEVAFAIAHRIVGSLPADEILAQLASEAIAEYGTSLQVTLRAAPEAAAYLRNFLKNSAHGHRVTVLADPAAAPGECSLSDIHGRTNLGLLAQFRAMMKALPDHHLEPESQR